MKVNLHIYPLANNEEPPYQLLELADPSKTLIESYLESGTCHIAQQENKVVGVIVLSQKDGSVIEVNNIAVTPSKQKQGIGRALLNYAEETSRKLGVNKLIIGTGNSSISQLKFYQKFGFEIERIEKDYFLKNYDHPIFENGIACKHKLLLTKVL